MTAITRLRLDAGLYDPAPVLEPGGKRNKPGPHPLKGDRQPTLESRLTDPATEWKRVMISNWYGEGDRTIEVATGTAVWYHSPDPVVPLRWVLIRPVEGDGRKAFKPQALLSTDLDQPSPLILERFVKRWSMEVTFEAGECQPLKEASAEGRTLGGIIWEWKHNGSGATGPSSGRRRSCWGCSRW